MPRKSDPELIRFCVVCGDRAKGTNFNALTCQSCKAFFRRNALSKKKLECPFQNCCPIDRITRKFCSSCRLNKCLAKGMKKDSILSEEDRRVIREKILENRKQRQLQSPDEPGTSATGSPNIRTMGRCASESERTISSTSPSLENYYVGGPMDTTTSNNETTYFENPVESEFPRFEELDLSGINCDSSSMDHLNTDLVKYIDNTQSNDQRQMLMDYNNSTVAATNTTTTLSSSSSCLITNDSGITQGNYTFNNDFFNLPPPTSNPVWLDLQSAYWKLPQSDDFLENQQQFIEAQPEQSEKYSGKKSNYLRDYLLTCGSGTERNSYESSATTQNFFFSFDSEYFSHSQKTALVELCNAGTVLHNSYIRMLFIRQRIHSHKCALTDSPLHRLIKMAKRLSAFSSLSLDDQVQLLKMGLIELLCLRSIQTFDPERQAWQLLDDDCKVTIIVSINAIQSCCIKFVRDFLTPAKLEWKTDNIIFNLLTAVMLFSDRPGVQAVQRIREEYARYTDLLRHYLEVKYPTRAEAESSFNQLMNIVRIIRMSHEDLQHVFASIHRVQSSPLLVQLLERFHRPHTDSHRSHCNIDQFNSVWPETENRQGDTPPISEFQMEDKQNTDKTEFISDTFTNLNDLFE